MKVIIRGRLDLLQAPVADIPALERMQKAWRALGVSEFQTVTSGHRICDEISQGERVLWFEGIFPFLTEELVGFLVSSSTPPPVEKVREIRCTRMRAPGSGFHGLAFFPAWKSEFSGFQFEDEEFWRNLETKELNWDPLDLQVLETAESFSILNECGFQMTRDRAIQSGALLLHPDTTWIGEAVDLEAGVVIHPGVTLRGKTSIGAGSVVHSGAVISDSELGPRVCVKPYTVIEQSRIAADAQIGPFAHLRPQTDVGENVRVGNFVETKKAQLGDGTKASHLSYIGDATIGRDCNVGAGTITCNYDGFNKNKTVLGDRVFIGSDSQLIAPVSLGDDAYVAAGSTVTNDVPAGDLAIARARQRNKAGFAERIRNRARDMSKKKSDT